MVSTQQSTSTEGWDTLDDVMSDQLVITDVGILSRREKAPPDYVVIENTHDGKKANFPEGRLSFSTRYICYTKKAASPQRGFVVVSDMKVLPASDRAPLGFLPLTHTIDDNSKAFSTKQFLVRFEAQEQAKEGISDIVILSASKKEDVPRGYKRLPEVNGFSICFKKSPLPKKSKEPVAKPAPSSQLAPPHSADNITRVGSVTSGRKIRSAIDGLQFTMKMDYQVQEYVSKYTLGDLQLLTLQDVENKYDFDFSQCKNLVNLQT